MSLFLRRIGDALDPYPRPMTETDPFQQGRVAEAEAAVAAERALKRQSGLPGHLPGPALDPVVFGPPR